MSQGSKQPSPLRLKALENIYGIAEFRIHLTAPATQRELRTSGCSCPVSHLSLIEVRSFMARSLLPLPQRSKHKTAAQSQRNMFAVVAIVVPLDRLCFLCFLFPVGRRLACQRSFIRTTKAPNSSTNFIYLYPPRPRYQ